MKKVRTSEEVYGRTMAAAREMAGFTREELAAKLNVDLADIIWLEEGIRHNAPLRRMIKQALEQEGIMVKTDLHIGLTTVTLGFQVPQISRKDAENAATTDSEGSD